MTGIIPSNPLGATIQTAELDNDSVTAAKIAQGTAAQVLMSNATPDTAWTSISGDVTLSSAGATTVTDLTITSEAQGDILYFNGTNWVRLAAGTSGNFLKTNGAGANPAWAAAGGGSTGTLDVSGFKTDLPEVDVASSTSYAAISGANYQLSITVVATSTVFAVAAVSYQITGTMFFKLIIDGTDQSETMHGTASTGLSYASIAGRKINVAAGARVIEVQYKTSAGSSNEYVNPEAGQTLSNSFIMAWAMKE